MKAVTRNFFAPFALLASLLFSVGAHAEVLQSDAPLFGGAPLQSLLKGSASDGPTVHNTQLVWGSSLTVSSLSGSGYLNIQLRDIGFPDALSSLKVLVTDLNGIWKQFDATGSLLTASVGVSGPTQLFAVVYAHGASGSPGLYDFRAGFAAAPVPLPAAVWLLLSGLGGLGLVRKRSSTV